MGYMVSVKWGIATFAALGLAAPALARPERAKRPSPQAAPRIRKITPATEAQIAAFRTQAMAWHQKAQKDIVPALHLVETRNFLVFSAWSRKNDARLRQVCETMYTHLRRQFALPRNQPVWAGKLPIFLFHEVRHFRRFTNEVDGRKAPGSGGYLSQRSDGFCYIVLNRAYSSTHFYGLLVHEGTHAFLARYRTDAPLVPWVNEGLAETMAARLVPGCEAATRYTQATAEAVRGNRDVSGIFRGVRLSEFDYGIAQSLVRFLIARDRKRFINFVKLLKVGASDEEALRHAYGLTRKELLAEWRRASKKALGRKR